MIQRSLVLIKPDAVITGRVGEILTRFERAGLKIVGAKFIMASTELAKNHYLKDTAWHKKIGEINIKDSETYGFDISSIYGTTDPIEIGKTVNTWLYEVLRMGPVFAFVFEGPQAVNKIRTLVGSTYPDTAAPGTIRGDFALDSPFSGTKRKRGVYNLIHSSGTTEEADIEINLWFSANELISYKRSHEDFYNY